MAKEYGFKYELVQYKWPRWLNQQTEKQRIMWGWVPLALVTAYNKKLKCMCELDVQYMLSLRICTAVGIWLLST